MNNENKIRNANNLDKLGIDIITKTGCGKKGQGAWSYLEVCGKDGYLCPECQSPKSQTLKDKRLEIRKLGEVRINPQTIMDIIDKQDKEFIRQLKEDWKTRCKKMEIMSGEVAIFELESIIKNRSGFSSNTNGGKK